MLACYYVSMLSHVSVLLRYYVSTLGMLETVRATRPARELARAVTVMGYQGYTWGVTSRHEGSTDKTDRGDMRELRVPLSATTWAA